MDKTFDRPMAQGERAAARQGFVEAASKYSGDYFNLDEVKAEALRQFPEANEHGTCMNVRHAPDCPCTDPAVEAEPPAPRTPQKRLVSPREVLLVITREIERAGGVRAFARKVGVSAAYVSDVKLGRRPAGKKMIAHLGWTLTVKRTAEHIYHEHDAGLEKSHV